MRIPREHLQARLAYGRQFGAEYRGGLSNHHPMALVALAEIGATEEQIDAFATFYEERLEPLQPAGELAITAENWRAALGQHQNNAEYRAFFSAEQERLGQRALLATYVPELMPGVSGGAFHPLIRLGYALDAQDEGEVAEALASWAMAYLELGKAEAPHCPPMDALHSLVANAVLGSVATPGRLLADRLDAIARHPDFAGVGALAPEATVEDLREPILAVYEGSGSNFVALHLVTSLHALRILASHVALSGEELAHYWRGACAAFVVIGTPSPQQNSETIDPAALPSWESIFERARRSKDDHVIKFVHTATSEEAAYGDVRYRALAARKVKLAA